MKINSPEPHLNFHILCLVLFYFLYRERSHYVYISKIKHPDHSRTHDRASHRNKVRYNTWKADAKYFVEIVILYIIKTMNTAKVLFSINFSHYMNTITSAKYHDCINNPYFPLQLLYQCLVNWKECSLLWSYSKIEDWVILCRKR